MTELSKWIKPSGVEVMLNNDEATIEAAEANGWKREVPTVVESEEIVTEEVVTVEAETVVPETSEASPE